MKSSRLARAWCVVYCLLLHAPLATAQEEQTPAGTVRTFNEELGLKLVWCPPGTFQMGSPATDKKAVDNEQPRHTVSFTAGFWLGQTEVTQEQWRKVWETTPWEGKYYVKDGPGYPAAYVSWEDVHEWCGKFTERERAAGRLDSGQEYRLPTEAQWEYACRAGTTTVYHFGDEAAKLGEFAWFDQNAYKINQRYAHQVGKKKANPWNLHDMHGNMWEWCQDWYEKDYYGSTPECDPPGPGKGSVRVYRGGSWFSPAGDCRAALRGRGEASIRSLSLGFRVALGPTGK